MPYSDIIDNRNTKLRDEVNALLGSSDEAKIAVGYLYLSGFYQIAERLPDITDKTQKDETKKQIEFVCGEVIL